jgi:hypothetical protein
LFKNTEKSFFKSQNYIEKKIALQMDPKLAKVIIKLLKFYFIYLIEIYFIYFTSFLSFLKQFVNRIEQLMAESK